ncbi:hypothetical protein DsansV1_C03g0029691 [Dioscorea sansibarensis]
MQQIDKGTNLQVSFSVIDALLNFHCAYGDGLMLKSEVIFRVTQCLNES